MFLTAMRLLTHLGYFALWDGSFDSILVKGKITKGKFALETSAFLLLLVTSHIKCVLGLHMFAGCMCPCTVNVTPFLRSQVLKLASR